MKKFAYQTFLLELTVLILLIGLGYGLVVMNIAFTGLVYMDSGEYSSYFAQKPFAIIIMLTFFLYAVCRLFYTAYVCSFGVEKVLNQRMTILFFFGSVVSLILNNFF